MLRHGTWTGYSGTRGAVLLLWGSLLLGAGGFRNGNVEQSCTDMTPLHPRTSSQTSSSPFSVRPERDSYSAGQDITVFLHASTSRSFKGFLLQAREVGGTSPVGSFIAMSTGAQALSCGGAKDSAVAHSSDNPRRLLQFRWRPGSGRSVQFLATFVQDFRTYWVGVASPLVKFTSEGSNSTAGTSALAVSSPSHGSAGPSAASLPPSLSAAPLVVSAEGCGVSRVCFRNPPDCDPAQDSPCFFMSAMLASPGSAVVQFQLYGPSDGYISFGFSDDQKMGNDDIYVCAVDGGVVQLQRAFSTGTSAPRQVPLGNVSDVRTSLENNVITCSFSSTNTIAIQRSSRSTQRSTSRSSRSTQRSTSRSSRSTQRSTQRSRESYYLLYAHGSSQNGRILIHRQTFVSEDRVSISRPAQISPARRPHIIKAHGALMLIAWMTLGSLGMMVARFNKGLATGFMLCGKERWFVVHVSLMFLTSAATAVAFVLAFAHAQTWTGGAHAVLGCLVMILCLLQPLGAVLRCGPQHPRRFLFNWCHALNAAALKVLSVAAVFTGLKLVVGPDTRWLLRVMGGLVGWEALCFVLSDLNLRWTNGRDETHLLKKLLGALLALSFLLGNLAFSVALLVGIGKA